MSCGPSSIAANSPASGNGCWSNGLADLVIAAAIVAGLPGTLAWVLGLLVGLDMIMAGAALIAMAMAARKAVP